MKFTNEIFIGRPIDNVFQFVGNPGNVPLWNYAIITSEKITPKINGEGAIYKQHRSFLGRTLEDTFIITEYNPNEVLTLKSIEAEYPFIISYSFKATGNGTLITNSFELHGKLVDNVPGVLLKHAVKTAVANNLHKLKEIIEEISF
jgi:uncharacterized membrane protein